MRIYCNAVVHILRDVVAGRVAAFAGDLAYMLQMCRLETRCFAIAKTIRDSQCIPNAERSNYRCYCIRYAHFDKWRNYIMTVTELSAAETERFY